MMADFLLTSSLSLLLVVIALVSFGPNSIVSARSIITSKTEEEINHRRALVEANKPQECPRRTASSSPCSDHTRSPHIPLRLRCFWNDEFDGDSIDQTSWSFQNLDVNGEVQHYTNRECDSEDDDWNYCVKNGVLTIRARNQGINCPQDPACAHDYGWQNLPPFKGYTSGRIMTKNKVKSKYGYLEVRARLPQAQLEATQSGLWPAIWLLGNNIDEGPTSCAGDQPEIGWPRSGEFDLMEWKSPSNSLSWNAIWNGKDGNLNACSAWPENGTPQCGPCRRRTCTGVKKVKNVAAATQSSLSAGNVQEASNVAPTSYVWNGYDDFPFRKEFNVYGLRWTSEKIEVFINGEKMSRLYLNQMDPVEDAFRKDMFVILNLAVGGVLGGEVDNGMDWTQATFDVDYVRWYQ